MLGVKHFGFTFIICIFLFHFSYADVHCGTIFDGLTGGKFDLQIQASKTSFGANWFDFGDNILSYEWSIFSDKVISLDSGLFNSCMSQFRYIPDIQPWKNVFKNKEGLNTHLNLFSDQFYFSAVRVTYKTGEQIIKISNGIQIINEEDYPNLFSNKQNNQENKNKHTNEDSLRYIQDSSCSIDEGNRCTASRISVADKLKELYGDAIFPFSAVESAIFPTFDDDNGDDDDDDDDGGSNNIWVLAPVLGVVLLALCLLLLFFLICAVCSKPKLPSRGSSAPKEKAAPMEFVTESDNLPGNKIDALEASTNTVVEFPDTQIRRLSISHQDPSGVGDSDQPKRGRAPHPIMTATSSSFRDYRDSAN